MYRVFGGDSAGIKLCPLNVLLGSSLSKSEDVMPWSLSRCTSDGLAESRLSFTSDHRVTRFFAIESNFLAIHSSREGRSVGREMESSCIGSLVKDVVPGRNHKGRGCPCSRAILFYKIKYI